MVRQQDPGREEQAGRGDTQENRLEVLQVHQFCGVPKL